MSNNNGKKKFGDVLKDNLHKLMIIVVSIIYIGQGVFAISKRDVSLWDILGSVFLSIIVGVILSSSLNNMGLKDGRKSETFQNSLKNYGITKEKATPYFDKLSSWCEYKNSQELELKKKEIIQSAGLNWKAYKVGYYKEHNSKLDEKQLQAIKNANSCRIIKINSRELLSDLPSNYKKFHKNTSKFGESEHDYVTRNAITDFVSKIAISIVCGLYSLSPLLTQENTMEIIANIIWNTMQIAMWLTFGVLKYTNARQFMEEEYRQTHIIQKTEYLNEFIVTMEKNPNIILEFDEDKEIDKYIEEMYKSKQKEMIDNEQREESVSN